jgi:hypothetical protein
VHARTLGLALSPYCLGALQVFAFALVFFDCDDAKIGFVSCGQWP